MTRMGTRRHLVVLAAAFGAASLPLTAAHADTEVGPFQIETGIYGPYRVTGDVEIGGRGISGDWGSAKFEEYQDFEPGPFTRGLVLVEDEALRNYVRAQFQYVGSFDQLYRLEFGSWGRWGVDAGYSEYPHTLYNSARTLYANSGGSDPVLSLPAGLQAQLQGIGVAARRSAALGTALQGAGPISLGIQYQEGHGEAFYRPTEELEGRLRFWTQHRSGNRNTQIPFGTPGGNFSTFAAPVNDRIHDVRAGLEWAEPGWSVALHYDGSFYSNDIDSLIVANPLRATNGFPLTGGAGNTSAPALGRLSVAPDNSAHSLDLTTAAQLPVGFPLRIAGTFGYQLRLQNDDFLPQTINPVLNAAFPAARSFARDSLHGQVNAWLGNIVLSGNPLRDLDFALRYRVYEFDNTTGLFQNPSDVETDSAFRANNMVENTPLDWLKQDLGFDAGYRLTKQLKLGFTLGWQSWRRSKLREVRNQNDHLVGAHIEARPVEWAVIRMGYRWANRRWGTYVTQAGEFPDLRKYDEANRVENAVDTLIQINPTDTFQLSLTGSYGYLDYVSTSYGLTNSRSWSVGGDISYQPFERLGFTAWYTYESNVDNQTSRTTPFGFAPGPFAPATNDWFSRFKSGASTAGLTADIVVWPELVDLQLNWLYQTSQSNTLTTGATPAAGAVVWPFNGDNLLSIGPTLAVHVTDHVTVRATYRYERYRLDDFQINDLSPYMPFASANSTDVYLGGRIDNYNANVFGMSAQYKF